MARNLSYYFSLVSPWAYLGHAELERIARARDVVIDYRPVNLMDLFPETGGLPLPKRHPSRQTYRFVEMQRWREARDVPLVLRPKYWPFDFKLADRAMLMASGLGDQRAVHLLIAFAFRAVWVEERNLADEATLAEIATTAGFDASKLIEAARSDAAGSAYAANFERARQDGVFGSPSYVLDGEVFWGQDRLGMLDAALVSGRAPYLDA
ncbi:MAG: 2-hydroxychromene-2-carboxylate isomerase [Beijerinckiaceae bacterium]|nr:2-hydroxychromene-2-carboxylate isomerase [Beijerinckiaceae bacterium]